MTKAAVAKSFTMHTWSDGTRRSKPEPDAVYGLIFPSNGVAGSNIGIDFTSTAMVPRFSHTVIWKANYVQQSGYYAWAWHCLSNNSWGTGSSRWEFGTHPYPADGSHDGSGYSTGGTGSSGTVHYHEIANGSDKISDGGSGLVVVKGSWLSQARTCEQVSTNYVHKYYPDIDGNPSFVITWTEPVASVAADPGVKFRFGCSPWTASGGTNDETPSGTFRHLLQYDRALSLAEIQTKIALTSDDTTDADIWYSNINPTPTDVSDKSGQGHNPAWANANRPTLYTG